MGGEVDVEERAVVGLLARIRSITRAACLAACGIVEVLGQFERDGDARDLEKRPFDRRGDGARIEHVDPGVRAGVDPRDDQVGRPAHQLADGEFDAVGGASLDHPAERGAVVVVDLLDDQGIQDRDRVPHAALLNRRGDHGHFAELPTAPCGARRPGANTPSSLVSKIRKVGYQDPFQQSIRGRRETEGFTGLDPNGIV